MNILYMGYEGKLWECSWRSRVKTINTGHGSRKQTAMLGDFGMIVPTGPYQPPSIMIFGMHIKDTHIFNHIQTYTSRGCFWNPIIIYNYEIHLQWDCPEARALYLSLSLTLSLPLCSHWFSLRQSENMTEKMQSATQPHLWICQAGTKIPNPCGFQAENHFPDTCLRQSIWCSFDLLQLDRSVVLGAFCIGLDEIPCFASLGLE